MLIFLRRFLVLAALMFWQGGFTFYAAVVVPTGQQVLGSHFEQGRITRQVTWWLNLVGAVALLPLTWDVMAARQQRRTYLRWTALVSLLVTLGILAVLHQRLESLLDAADLTTSGFDRRAFRPPHRLYLWVSTIQWAAAVVYAGLSLRHWRAEDRTAIEP
jgi:hypothetical protein